MSTTAMWKWAPLAALCAVLFLGACDDDEAKPAPAPAPPPLSAITVASASGTRQAVDGIWRACFDSPTDPDVKELYSIIGTTLVVMLFDYTSSDGSCSTGEVAAWSIFASLSNPLDVVMTGWTDGAVLVGAPAKDDLSGPLDDPPAGTRIDVAVTASNGVGAPVVGETTQVVWMIDDTGAQWRKYRDSRNLSATCPAPAGTLLVSSCLHANELVRKL